MDNRVGVNGLDKAGSTALYWACHGGHKGILELNMIDNLLLLLICGVNGTVAVSSFAAINNQVCIPM